MDTNQNPALDRLIEKNKKINELLQKEQVVVEKNGVKLTMRGDQRVLDCTINGVKNQDVIDAINDANGQTQLIAADRLVQISTEE
jgi:hypothetical protein